VTETQPRSKFIKRPADSKLLADLTKRQTARLSFPDLHLINDDLRPSQLLALSLRSPQSRNNPLIA